MKTQVEEPKSESTTTSKLNLRTRLRMKYFSLKYKVKRINFNFEKVTINFFIGMAFFSIAIGLIIFITFLFKLSKDYTISGSGVILDKSSQVGDFVGGIVGTVWALTGVLLFYATLRLQSRELAENRKHFQISRLTDIIYKQLELFNSQLSIFELKDIERDTDGDFILFKGRSAIHLLRKRVESIIEIEKVDKNEQAKKKAMSKFMTENFAFIELNKGELQNIYEKLDNHVNVIRAVLIKEEIPPADLNELKSIFFRNIGRDLLNASVLLKYFLEWYITLKKGQDKDYNLLFLLFNQSKIVFPL